MRILDFFKILYAIIFLNYCFNRYKFQEFLYKKLTSRLKLSVDNIYSIKSTVDMFCKLMGIKSCLLKSKIIHELCIINEIQCSLLIGIRYEKNNMSSHAWVETSKQYCNHKDYKVILAI